VIRGRWLTLVELFGLTSGILGRAALRAALCSLDGATIAGPPPRPAPPAIRKVAGWIIGLPSAR